MAIGLPSKRAAASAAEPTKRYTGGGFKVSLLGSIENDFRGLRLKGDQMSPGRGKFYGVTKTGEKGFVTLDDIDPKSEGAVFGIVEHTDTSTDSETLEASGKPFGYFAISSTMVKEEEDETGNKFLSVYAFGRPIFFTAAGRAFKIGEEEIRCVGAFPVAPKVDPKVEIRGTSGSAVKASKIRFASASDSNVSVNVTYDEATDTATCTVGVYYTYSSNA